MALLMHTSPLLFTAGALCGRPPSSRSLRPSVESAADGSLSLTFRLPGLGEKDATVEVVEGESGATLVVHAQPTGSTELRCGHSAEDSGTTLSPSPLTRPALAQPSKDGGRVARQREHARRPAAHRHPGAARDA